LKQSSPAANLDYEDKKQTLRWEYAIENNRASTKTYKENPSGIEPEREGIWGSTTMYMDNNGVNHLTIELEAGWDYGWESKKNSQYDGMYAGLEWSVIPTDSININSDKSFTLKTALTREVAILGAKRDSSDSAKVSTPALDFYDLVQDTVDIRG